MMLKRLKKKAEEEEDSNALAFNLKNEWKER